MVITLCGQRSFVVCCPCKRHVFYRSCILNLETLKTPLPGVMVLIYQAVICLKPHYIGQPQSFPACRRFGHILYCFLLPEKKPFTNWRLSSPQGPVSTFVLG